MAEESNSKVDDKADATANDKPFIKVSNRRKRKQDEMEQMETGKAIKRPNFPPVSAESLKVLPNQHVLCAFQIIFSFDFDKLILGLVFLQGGKSEFRKIPVPPHRYTPLKEHWLEIFNPVVEHLKLQMRFNLTTRNVEIKVRLRNSTDY